MEGALLILVVTILAGLVLYIMELRHRRRHPVQDDGDDTTVPEAGEGDGSVAEANNEEEGQQCCGLHLVCEKDTLSPVSSKIEYYDDEELDRFIGRDGSDYTEDEIEEFQEILITMRPEDVVGWARSITQRRITLPAVVRDELLMLVNEQRAH